MFCKNLSSLRSNCTGGGYLKASELKRKTPQVARVAQEGKPRAKTGRNKQTNQPPFHQAGKSGKAA
jgi:hypothetical protein